VKNSDAAGPQWCQCQRLKSSIRFQSCPRTVVPHNADVIRGAAQLLFAICAFFAPLVSAAPPAETLMTSNEVVRVLTQAIARAEQIMPNAVIAVVDREGYILGVWTMDGDTTNQIAQLNILDAITKAGTASYLSSDEHAFTSRTAGFIVQQNFPPRIRNRGTGPLVGVNFSNLSFTDVNRFKNPNSGRNPLSTESGTNGDPVPGPAAISGLAGSPGGMPLFRDGKLIGGVGVAGSTRAPVGSPLPALADIQVKQVRDADEDVALAGQIGFRPSSRILGSRVLIDGIRVPYVKSKTKRGTPQPLGTIGSVVPGFEIADSPLVAYPTNFFGGQICEVRAPIIDDPLPGLIRGAARLTSNEVQQILSQASARAKITRAGIRLPRGKAAQTFITVVNNPDQTNATPLVLGTIRTPGATLFSWDVAIQKARTAVFFSDDTRAFSSRSVGFLAQQFFPPGIANTSPGPFYGLQELFSLVPVGITNPLNRAFVTNALTVPNPNLTNGITIFPGGFPLYRDGVLIGAIGVSGDGIDQDDIIAAAGTVGFLPPTAIRADSMEYRGARLPYAKFPRNPDL
jgi:uncharacterized protein GlcG (DUF336 family)